MSQPLPTSAPRPEFENTHLKEIWGRFETVARKLWIENSAAAVGLQSLIEEFRTEITRVEDTLVSYRKNYLEQKEIIEKTYFAEKVSALESSIAQSGEKIAALENELALKRSKIKEFEGLIAAKEDELARAHNRHIQSTLENSEQFNQKIETLYQDVMAKESAIMPLWGKRLKELEEQYRTRTKDSDQKNGEITEALKKREALLEQSYQEKIQELRLAQQKAMDEIAQWSSKKLKEEQELMHRAQAFELKTQEMEHELKKKHMELETLKENMRQEVTQLVKRYQGPDRQGGAPSRSLATPIKD